MKKLYTLFAVTLFGFMGNTQIINFPDANLKMKLLAAGPSNYIARNFSGSYVKIDTNNNNEIEVSEALVIDELNIENLNPIASIKITNLTGITAFSNMTKFYCFDNLITTLDLTSLINLTTVGCDMNQITNLNISGLSNLVHLSCEQNLITSLDLTNKPNLGYINCLENNLSSLNVSGLYNLSYLRASNNPYPTLDLTGLENITSLQCMYTNISMLDVSNLHNLTTLMCGNNPNLTNIFMKNGIVESSLNIENVPNLNYICADQEQLSSLQNHLNFYSNAPNYILNTYCSFVPGGDYYTIQATNSYDDESNGCDNNDMTIPFVKFSIANFATSGLIVSNQNGGFTIPVQEGIHTLSPIIENPNYFSVSPPNVLITFPDSTSPFVQNFCIAPNGTHNDLEVAIFPIGPARPGFDAQYKIIYKNKGTAPQSGTINLLFGDTVSDFVLATPVATSQNTGSLNWNFTNLLPFETREISVTFNLNSPLETPPLNAGNILGYALTINGATDETPNDNNTNLYQTVVNSFDPNDKTCVEGINLPLYKVGDYVHYVIRFENTGTFAAENIVVKDMIDPTKFEIGSLIPMSGSHPFTTRIINTNQVEFIFENINLPFEDANNDGYVAFKIKTKPTLIDGDIFSNSASIYFDYNAPIITNTYTTNVYNQLNINDFNFSSFFSLSPVPTKDVITITTKETVIISSVNIFNTLGQLIQINTNPNQTIDVSGLQSGSYFIKIISDKGTATGEFIKE